METNNSKKSNKKNRKKSKNRQATDPEPQQPQAVVEESTEVSALTNQMENVNVTTTVVAVSTNEPVESQPAPSPAPQESQVVKLDKLQEAVQILGKARIFDESKQYENALKSYRQGVDMLLEELIERQGTEQSRTYLRDKCNDFMNRIDQLKMIIKLQNESAANKENTSV